MKSAIGIGTLLADGLGDTIRVSLTEDPEYEYAPCNRLAELGAELRDGGATNAAQRDGDTLDYRGLLHRDGSGLSALSGSELNEMAKMGQFGSDALFRALGCKLLQSPDGTVPLKDVATTDTLLLREPPAEDAIEARKCLATLAKAGMHCVVPAAALAANPLAGAVPLVMCADLEQKLVLREGKPGALGDSGRIAVTVRGDESDEQLATLCARE